MENIFAKDFFAIEHPTAPLVNIQFRTKLTETDITDPSNWTSVTFNPSTFFNSLSIEDRGGAQMLTLSLFDKNYARLENTIVKSILVARLANKLVGESNISSDDTNYFEFYISKSSSANIRIRFGYSQFGNDDGYIDETSTNDEAWINRVTSKMPVIRSPWLYFQMSKANFKITQEGLKIEMAAFSVTGSFLSKARLIQKFAKVVGTPKDVIEQIGKIVTAAAAANGDIVKFEMAGVEPSKIAGIPPSGYPTEVEENGETTTIDAIEIMLGSEASVPRTNFEDPDWYKSERMYKTLRTILNEICSKVRPIVYDVNGDIIPPSDDTTGVGVDEESESLDKTANYGYTIVENDIETIVQFYYQDPNEQMKTQMYLRNYVWNETGHSIIKSLDIQTKTDFAMLNLQIATIDTDTGNLTVHVARGGEIPEEDRIDENGEVSGNQDTSVDYTIGRLQNVTDALNNANFNAMFVTNIRETSSYQVSGEQLNPNQAAAIISRKIVSNINNQVFNGTITLPGDPYYLFDGSIKPFSYLIQVIIRRPNYVNDSGEFVPGGTSYSSGLYVIKKITHTISGSGYETELSIMKWPRKS